MIFYNLFQLKTENLLVKMSLELQPLPLEDFKGIPDLRLAFKLILLNLSEAQNLNLLAH